MFRRFRRSTVVALPALAVAVCTTLFPSYAALITPASVTFGALAAPPTSAAPSLFTHDAGVAALDAAHGVAPGAGRPGLLRTRAVNVRFDTLHALRGLRPGTGRVDLNLFSDVRLTGLVDRVLTHATDSVSFSGRLLNDPAGSFALVAHKGALVGTVRTQSGDLYEIGVLDGSLHTVQQIDPASIPPCGVTPAQFVAAGDASAAAEPPAVPEASTEASAADGGATGGEAAGDEPSGGYQVGPVIDVLIVYTPKAMELAKSQAAIEAKAQLAVDQGNLAYFNSGINASLRLVAARQVSYIEQPNTSAGWSTTLSHLANDGDEQMDEVHIWRTALGADVVSLLVASSSPYAGLGYVMTSLSSGFAGSAFNVVSQGYTSGTTLAHEIGHNQGCHHDREHATDTNGNLGRGLYTYSYGWRFDGNDGREYRTVMSYLPGTQIPYFSNPNVTFMGVPTGVATGQPNESNNALSINNARAVVSGWRASRSLPLPVLVDATLVSESEPANGAVEPGEVVTMDVWLRNASSGTGSNVVATLVPTSAIEPIAGEKTYATMIGGGAPLAQPFQFRVNAACGSVVPATLRLSQNGTDLGTVTFPIWLGASRAIYSSDGVALPITGSGIVEHTLAIPDDAAIQDLKVHVRLEHTYDYYLTLTLIAPDGTEVDLSSRSGSSADGFGTGPNDCGGDFAVFDDGAAQSIVSAKSPIVGAFRPETPLAAFAGKNLKGNWTLRVANASSSYIGTLGCWKLEALRQLPGCGTPPSVTMADVVAALRIAGGMAAPEGDQAVRLNLHHESPVTGSLDLPDAVAVALKAMGLD